LFATRRPNDLRTIAVTSGSDISDKAARRVNRARHLVERQAAGIVCD
jgi:hypothetical protein